MFESHSQIVFSSLRTASQPGYRLSRTVLPAVVYKNKRKIAKDKVEQIERPGRRGQAREYGDEVQIVRKLGIETVLNDYTLFLCSLTFNKKQVTHYGD